MKALGIALIPFRQLISTISKRAVLTGKEEIAQQVLQIVTQQQVNTIDHQTIPIRGTNHLFAWGRRKCFTKLTLFKKRLN